MDWPGAIFRPTGATAEWRAPDGRKVKPTIDWASAEHAVKAEVRLYEQLFTVERHDDAEAENVLNPNSMEVIENAYFEPPLAEVKLGEKFQFERTGYFCTDLATKPGKPVFNRTVTLKESWVKIEKKS